MLLLCTTTVYMCVYVIIVRIYVCLWVYNVIGSILSSLCIDIIICTYYIDALTTVFIIYILYTIYSTFLAYSKPKIDRIWSDISDIIVKTLLTIQPTLIHAYKNYKSRGKNNNNPFTCFEV